MILEELIRKFNAALTENASPRDHVHLMVGLMLAGDETRIRAQRPMRTVYDRCCGAGGSRDVGGHELQPDS